MHQNWARRRLAILGVNGRIMDKNDALAALFWKRINSGQMTYQDIDFMSSRKSVARKLAQGRYCRSCSRWRPYDEFPSLIPPDDPAPLRYRLDFGFSAHCNECRINSAAVAEYAARSDAREAINFPLRVYEALRKEGLGRAERQKREKAGGWRITVGEWRELKARYGNRCLACGKAEGEITLVKDHVIPLSAGGSNEVTNIQPLCAKCNATKHCESKDFRESPHASCMLPSVCDPDPIPSISH